MLDKKHEKLAYRLVGILQKLNMGERLHVKSLAEEYQVSVRTIQTDLNERFAFLQIEKSADGFYQLEKSKLGHLSEEDVARFAHFAGIQNLFPERDRTFFQEKLIGSILVKGFQYEDIKDKQREFNQIKKAIEECRPIEFHYQKKGAQEGKYYILQPYVLLNKNGIWYAIGRHEGRKKTFCFGQMSAMNVRSETFEPDEALLAEIRQTDSISYGNQIAEVVIQVSAKAAPYFLHRNLLPNQELVRKLEDGGLLLACKNVNEMEVVPTVQYWIPHLTIISPPEIQKKMENKLSTYLSGNNE